MCDSTALACPCQIRYLIAKQIVKRSILNQKLKALDGDFDIIKALLNVKQSGDSVSAKCDMRYRLEVTGQDACEDRTLETLMPYISKSDSMVNAIEAIETEDRVVLENMCRQAEASGLTVFNAYYSLVVKKRSRYTHDNMVTMLKEAEAFLSKMFSKFKGDRVIVISDDKEPCIMTVLFNRTDKEKVTAVLGGKKLLEIYENQTVILDSGDMPSPQIRESLSLSDSIKLLKRMGQK